ncbi:response regulator [Fundidesulfovibrio putealis]|uniref:response regulator n=1 Tax=Fundidesulfovibrio putealis TaxID=270496 RepID=UPI0003F8CD24|nr:response regulator [Fundidesulfovibrio putealis]
MRALIIDDDPFTRLYFEEVLAPHASTISAASGAEGLCAFAQAIEEEKPFDAVLVDICMPGMDGHQTLQKLRNLEREAGVRGEAEAAVVMVSALSDSRNVNRAFFQGGAMSFLTKPVTPDVLVDELRKFGLIS